MSAVAGHISAVCLVILQLLCLNAGQGCHARWQLQLSHPLACHPPHPLLPLCRVVGLLGKRGYADATVKVEWMKAWHAVWRVSARRVAPACRRPAPAHCPMQRASRQRVGHRSLSGSSAAPCLHLLLRLQENLKRCEGVGRAAPCKITVS